MIEVTSAAQDKLSEILAGHPTADGRVRVSVVRGPHGCVHGWSLGIEHKARSEDVIYASGAVNVVVEPGLADELVGATIDYTEGTAIGFTINTPPHRDEENHAHCHH